MAEHLVAGRLRCVLRGFEPEAIPVNIVFRANPRRWSPVRGFVDLAVPTLRHELARIAGLLEA